MWGIVCGRFIHTEGFAMQTKVARLKCLDCCGGSSREVKACPIHDCAVWPYRFGREPETVAKREPQLMDPVYVVLAGAVLDEPDSAWARWCLDNPRKALGDKLTGFDDDKIAATIAEIRATPAGELFAGSIRRPTGGQNPFSSQKNVGDA